MAEVTGLAISFSMATEGSGGSSNGWQRRLEQLLVEARKRNMINTYVWDGDGGLRSAAD